MVLCFVAVAAAFVLAAAVPIFSDLIGITAALFAAWYTYGLAGFFWLHDTYYSRGWMKVLRQKPLGTMLAVLTILSGGFICAAGTCVSVKVWPRDILTRLLVILMEQIQLIVDGYRDDLVERPFEC